MSAQKDNLIKVGAHTITITNPGKIMFPQNSITKLEVIDYYNRIAPIMMNYVHNRIVSMVRYPEGINHEGFYHKNAPEYFPTYIKRFPLESGGDKHIVNYVVITNKATIVYLANYGCLVFHPWLSTIKNIYNPDRIIIDLDPNNVSFSHVKKAAYFVKNVLDQLQLTSFVMTTGSRGLHVTIPLKPRLPFEKINEFATQLASYLTMINPDLLTTEFYKKKRGKRVFVDVLRNQFTATAVAPYSLRATPVASIATPLTWQELKTLKSSQQHTIHNIFKRLQRIGDPWHDMKACAQTITQAHRILQHLIKEIL